MPKSDSHAADLQGLARITIAAIVGVTEMAEVVHMNILKRATRLGPPAHRPLAGVTSLVYKSVRGVTYLVGKGIDGLLDKLIPVLGESSAWRGRDAVLAALNGVLGDYLAATDNPLAIRMQLRHGGRTLELNKAALDAAIPDRTGRILVMAHGLCMNDLQWRRKAHDHGAALARERGYTALYLRYNTGRHISTNGREFAEQLEQLVKQWPVPVEELVILTHSMGGLVARSACHYGALAGYQWPAQLRKLVFLGTPHHGAPLERGGNWFHVIANVSSFTAPFSSLGKIRSAGITDLRYGSVLDDDWEGQDRFRRNGDRRRPLPLPAPVQCYAIAATTGKQTGDISDRLMGDGLVPLESALGRNDKPELNLNFAADHQWIGYGMNHLDLLNRDEVYARLLEWL